MRIARQIGIDIAHALCVLGLVFLSFGHAPIGLPHGPVLTAVVDLSLCGGAPGDDGKAHAPCHACRIGAGADLPRPCAIRQPLAALADIAYGAMPAPLHPAPLAGPHTARGPPTA